MGNLAKLGADYKQCNYIKMANEILFITKEVNGETIRISPTAKSVFLTIMNLPKDWELTEKGMATIMGMSEYSIRKVFKELKEWGYLDYQMMKDSDGKYTEKLYILREVINSPLDMDRCIFPTSANSTAVETTRMETTRMDSHSVENHSDGDHSDGFWGQYNNIINNNIINNDLNLNNNLYIRSNSEEFVAESPLEKTKEDLSHGSQENYLTSSSNLPKITKHDWAAHHDKNHDITQMMVPKDPINEAAEKKRKKEEMKNRVQKAELEKGNSIRTMDTQGARLMSELTSEDNEASRAVTLVKRITELNKQVNKTNLDKLSNIEQMQKEADKIIPDMEVSKWFNDYLEVKIQKTGKMAKPTVRLLYDSLKEKACEDKNTMILLLKEAIRLGWNDFYVSDNIQQQVENSKQVQQIKTETEIPNEDDYCEVLDENGNPIKF